MIERPVPDRTRIKVCGIRDLDAALAAAQAGADAIGFVFVDDSPRRIEPEAASEIMWALPPLVETVGVCRDLTVDAFSDLEQRCPTSLSQLHGAESEKIVAACGPNLIKAFRFDPATIDRQLERWASLPEVDAVLIDGSDGGRGEPFDWDQLVPHIQGYPKPILLAGGLDPDNVGHAIRTVRPYAVDVSTGVERAPGVKDHDKIRAFCAAVRGVDGEATERRSDAAT